MSRTLLALSLLLTLAACAGTTASAGKASSTPQGAADAAAKGKKGEEWICTYEKPIGSNIPEQICRPKKKADEDRGRTQDMMRTMPHTTDKIG